MLLKYKKLLEQITRVYLLGTKREIIVNFEWSDYDIKTTWINQDLENLYDNLIKIYNNYMKIEQKKET
jgi:hypothetical protein